MMTTYTHRARRALRGAAFGALALFAVAACDDEVPPPFEVEGIGTISGLLFFDAERDGAYEPLEGDSVLAGVPVRLTIRGDSTQTLSSTVTDAEGRFTFAGVAVGTHDLVFNATVLGEEDVVACQNPRPVSVRRSEVTSVVVTAQLSCLITIEEARALPDGEIVTVRGVVTVGTGDISGSYFFLQDETGGVKIFQSGSGAVGQFVEVTGETDVFGGEEEIINASVTLLGTAPLPDPVVITGEELASSDFQGSLVTVLGLEVTGIEETPGSGWNIDVVAPDGEVFLVRLDIDTDIPVTTFTVGGVYDLTGIVSPFSGAEQLLLRVPEDVDPVE